MMMVDRVRIKNEKERKKPTKSQLKPNGVEEHARVLCLQFDAALQFIAIICGCYISHRFHLFGGFEIAPVQNIVQNKKKINP